MSSTLTKLKGHLLSFRLVAGYFLFFFVSTTLLFGLSVFLLDQYVTKIERQRFAEKLEHYKLIQNEKGFAYLVAELRKLHKANTLGNLYIHLTDSNNNTIWQTIPEQFKELPSDFFATPLIVQHNNWQFIDLPTENDLDVFAHVLPGGQTLHFGRTTEQQELIVDSMGHMFAGILAAIILFGVAGGLFMANQVLRPVKRLTRTVKEVASGDMSSRVPVNNPKGELDELAELVNGMLQRIETLLIAMRDALDNVGHDLRTPLARMKAKIEQAVINDVSPERQRETLLDCAEEIDRINKLITMLMDIAEAETGQMRLNKESLNASDLLKDIVGLYDLIAEERGITLHAEASDVILLADRQRITQALGNLTDNALKYTPEGGTVTLTATTTPNMVILTVQDTGPGIPKDERERIFDKLYRLDKSRSTKGLGLGLSLVKAVISAHGGTVTVTNAPEGGSIFKTAIPSPAKANLTPV